MKAWQNFLKLLDKELGKDTVDKWLRPLRVLSFDACNLYLEALDTFQIIWFEEHVAKNHAGKFKNNNNKTITIHLSTPSTGKETESRKKAAKPDPSDDFSLTFDQPDKLCTLSNFIASEANLLAYKLICKLTNYDAVSETFIPAETELAAFNPIYLFGAEGTGKTHLLMACAHALKAKQLKVLYVRAETFTEQVVAAIRAGKMRLFRQAYRTIDALLIDDVHLFAKKGATQEELFHTFNALHLSGKQLILAANCSPAELQHIEPRLVSRFEWGIVLPLEQLNFEERKQMIAKKAAAFQVTLHPKVEEFLAATFVKSSKALTRAFEALLLRHHMKLERDRRADSPITVQIARALLMDLIDEEEQAALTPEKIIKIVAEYFGIKTDDIVGKSKNRDCALPRHLAIYFCRNKLNMPYTKIGDIFLRDHSTVMSSVKLVDKGCAQKDKQIIQPHQALAKLLNK